MPRMIFTTNPGIEDIAAEEISAKLSASIEEVRSGRGRVISRVPESKLFKIDTLRSIHRARILLGESRICETKECLNVLRELLESLPFEQYITPSVSFAVRAERVGFHEFTSLDVARVAGDAIISRIRSRYGVRPPVDLDHPAVIVSVDVMFDRVYASIELGGDLSWHRRGYRVYEHPAALKPTLAYAMIVLSGMRDNETILDPMCGGGTIPIEALLVFESASGYCSDFNPSHIRGARMNAVAARVASRIRFFVLDAREISSRFKRVERIVLNPPYGIRLGNPRVIRELYTAFLHEVVKLDFERLVMITTEYEHVRKVSEELGLRIMHERRVAHGSLWPEILVISH